jgi:hypothetical protein
MRGFVRWGGKLFFFPEYATVPTTADVLTGSSRQRQGRRRDLEKQIFPVENYIWNCRPPPTICRKIEYSQIQLWLYNRYYSVTGNFEGHAVGLRRDHRKHVREGAEIQGNYTGCYILDRIWKWLQHVIEFSTTTYWRQLDTTIGRSEVPITNKSLHWIISESLQNWSTVSMLIVISINIDTAVAFVYNIR